MDAGDLAVLRFPFSDLSGSKLRPVVILAKADRNDFIACQVTSNKDADPHAVELTGNSFSAGELRMASYIRPGKLFTANQSIVTKVVARLTPEAIKEVKAAVIEIIRG